eukprot:12398681-Karenia_brevis.AAC.1
MPVDPDAASPVPETIATWREIMSTNSRLCHLALGTAPDGQGWIPVGSDVVQNFCPAAPTCQELSSPSEIISVHA